MALPAFLYFYFTTQKIAKITISTSSRVSFSVNLLGSFGVDGLPLADKFLSYQKKCTDICEISPILPARYTIILTASGKTTLTDSIVVNSGENITRTYIFNDDIQIVPVKTLLVDDALPISLVENARLRGWWEFIIIGTDIKNKIWVIKKWENSSQVGILSIERFAPIRTISLGILSSSIDISRSVLIINLLWGSSLLLSTDLVNEKEIPTIPNIISVIPGDIWRIHSQTWMVEVRWDQIIEDNRFTNSIDISPEIRIGYIDKKDTKKLSLSNLPLTESLLIRLDRTTGESVILRKWLDISALFLYGNKPAYIDTLGNISLIEENSIK